MAGVGLSNECKNNFVGSVVTKKKAFTYWDASLAHPSALDLPEICEQ